MMMGRASTQNVEHLYNILHRLSPKMLSIIMNNYENLHTHILNLYGEDCLKETQIF